MTRTTPVVFGGSVPILGMLTLPEGNISGPGIVISAPFGHEHTMAYRPLRALARRLAERGRPALRFDWPGSGDSGDPGPQAVEGASRWTTPLAEAAGLMRETTGEPEVSLVGLRVGATVALLAAAADTAFSDVVLLAPFVTGRAYLQYLEDFNVATHLYLDPPPPQRTPLPAGAMEASGFVLDASDVRTLENIDLGKSDLSLPSGRRALVLVTEEDETTAGLARLLEDAGTEVAYERCPKLARVWGGTNGSYMPGCCRRRVTEWLQRRQAIWRRPAVVIQPRKADIRLGDEEPHEEAVVFESPRGQSFGVVCRPPPDVEASDTWVVFLSSARVRRSGPNRLWTTYARRWAAVGLPSLRFDWWGAGDSDGSLMLDELPLRIRKQFFSSPVRDDIQTSLAWLGENCNARRFALVGLCSGAYWAFHTALTDTRVASIALINFPWLYGHERPLLPNRARRNMWVIASNPRMWTQAVGATSRSQFWELVRADALELARLRGRSYGAEILRSFGNLTARGTSVLVLFTENDKGLAYLERHLGHNYQSLLEESGVVFEVLEGADHTFRQLWSQDRLRNIVEDQFRPAASAI